MILQSMVSRPRPWLRALPGGAGKAEATARPAGTPAGDALSDTELFEGIARGDARIAAELYRRLLPAVEAALYRVLGRREAEHEDLVQSSFEQIILTLSERRYAQACSLNTWASTLAAHVALKALRSRYRRRRVFSERVEPGEYAELPGASDDVERSVGVRREIERLRGVLSELSPKYAEAVMLHDMMGHPLAEIAAITGVTIAAAQSRLVRGRKELAERMRSSRGEGRDHDATA